MSQLGADNILDKRNNTKKFPGKNNMLAKGKRSTRLAFFIAGLDFPAGPPSSLSHKAV